MNMKTRRYDSPARAAQAAATRARIMGASVALMTTGAELTYEAVAREAGVRDRTVYRYFPTKDDLETALWGWILDNLTHVDFGARTTDDLVAAVHRSFAGFDAGAPLIQGMLHSRQGLAVRLRQQPERRAMFEACAAAALPDASPAVRLDVAAALQVLYSAPTWETLRTFWGMDGARAAAVVASAIRALLAGAGRAPPDRPSDASPDDQTAQVPTRRPT